jgi:hypothetical protein
MIEFECPKCSSQMSTPSHRGGQSETCPSCGKSVAIPDPAPNETPSKPWQIDLDAWPVKTGRAYKTGGGIILGISMLGSLFIIAIMFDGGNTLTLIAPIMCLLLLAIGGTLVMGVGAVLEHLSKIGRLIASQKREPND